ncbi:unnamed protein product, partial [Gulo gulo]
AGRGGAQGLGDAPPRVGATASQVRPVSRPRKSLRGGLCEKPWSPASHLPQLPGVPRHSHLSSVSPLSACPLGAPVRGNKSRVQ